MTRLQRFIRDRVIILDGATGTNLLGPGLEPGESPSVLNIRDENRVLALHKAYVKAGSDVILTNTFSANGRKFAGDVLRKVIRSGVALARRAAGHTTVLGDVGPLGDLILPYGAKDFESAVHDYQQVFRIFRDAGLRRFFLETFTSIIDAKAAFLAAEAYATDIFVSFSFQDSGHTVMGDTPESIAITFEALGARGVGVNCSSPEHVAEVIARMARVVRIPLIAKPNAGSVATHDGHVRHTLADADLGRYFSNFVRAGANIVGGCCGTTPEYIRMIARKRVRPAERRTEKAFFLVNPGTVINVDEKKVIVVGERLNPSGRKKLRASLEQGNYTEYGAEAIAQEKAGADALDVNAFVDILDECDTLTHAVQEVLKASCLPVFVDTQNYKAAEAVLRSYPGLGVYNSIPARREALTKWLPMIRRYGFKAVISLVGRNIPKDSRERMRNVMLALRIARRVRFPVADLVFDPLVFPVATGEREIKDTLETLSKLHGMGLRTVMGISNVSYGLPDRSLLNQALIASAVEKHATFLIMNPLDETAMGVVNASRVLFVGGSLHDFIEQYRKRARVPDSRGDLISAIVHGDVSIGGMQAEKLLDAGINAQELVESYLAKGLEIVGANYEQGKFYIPDLLKAAEVARAVLLVMRQRLPREPKRGTIVLATVKGDIHDIGKRLAAAIFESAGYGVVDLGVDVAAETIVKAVRRHKPDFVGLSALLTTTMPEMANVVKALKNAGLDVKVIVGGPNVSTAYAQKIGAFGAARSVFEGLKLIRRRNRSVFD